jgi:hypothetical protein
MIIVFSADDQLFEETRRRMMLSAKVMALDHPAPNCHEDSGALIVRGFGIMKPQHQDGRHAALKIPAQL